MDSPALAALHPRWGLLLLSLAATLPTGAANQSWTGNAFPDRSWFAPANWSAPDQAPPGPADAVELPPESSVFLGRDVTVAELRIQSDAVVNGAGATLLVTRSALLAGTVTNLTLVVGEGAKLNWQSPASGAGTRVVNHGTIEATGCRMTADGLVNGGEVTLGDGACLEVAELLNEGTLRKGSGPGVAQLSGESFHNVGELEVATGALLLDRFQVRSDGVIRLGRGQASLQLYGGTLILGSNSVVVLGVGGNPPFAGHDEIRANGAVTLGGLLRIQWLAGPSPLPGQLFNVLGYAAKTGDFARIMGLDHCNGQSVAPVYTIPALALMGTNSVQGDFPELVLTPAAAEWEFCWPPGFAGYELQSSSNLVEWSVVEAPRNPWPLSPAADGRYFRLWKP